MPTYLEDVITATLAAAGATPVEEQVTALAERAMAKYTPGSTLPEIIGELITAAVGEWRADDVWTKPVEQKDWIIPAAVIHGPAIG